MNISKLKAINASLLSQINELLHQLSPDLSDLTLRDLQVLIDNENTLILVAKNENEQVVGMLTLIKSMSPSGLKTWIEDVVVDQSARGQGIAKSLINESIALAQNLNAKSINLTSKPSRVAANELYKKLGFKIRDTNVYRLTL